MACITVLVLIAPTVFVLQNSGSTQVSFLALHGRHSLTVALWTAIALCGTLTLAFGATRALHACRILPRHQTGDLAATVPIAISHAIDLTADLSQSSVLAHHAQHITTLQNLDKCA